MNISVNIPPEAVKVAFNALDNLLNKTDLEAKSKDQISPKVLQIAKEALADVESGAFDAAIYKLETVLEFEPKYNRARVIVADAYKEKGWSKTAIFVGGVAFGRATDTETKAMILSLVSEICLAHYKQGIEVESSLEEALEFIDSGINEHPNDVVLRWNQIDALLLSNAPPQMIRRKIVEIIDLVPTLPNTDQLEIQKILLDWETIFAKDDQFDDLKIELSQLEAGSSPDDSAKSIAGKKSYLRKSLQIALLVGMIAGSPAVVASIDYFDGLSTTSIQSEDNTQAPVPPGDPEQLASNLNVYDPYQIEASIKREKGKLLQVAAISRSKTRFL